MFIFINYIQWYVFSFSFQRLKLWNCTINLIASFDIVRNLEESEREIENWLRNWNFEESNPKLNLINDSTIDGDESQSYTWLDTSSTNAIDTRRDPWIKTNLPFQGVYCLLDSESGVINSGDDNLRRTTGDQIGDSGTCSDEIRNPREEGEEERERRRRRRRRITKRFDGD